MAAAEPQQDPFSLVVFLTSGADLGRAVEIARRRSGETQAALAKRCRVGRRFVYELEAGKKNVRLDKALQVMYAVGIAGMLVPLELVREAMGR
jgi:DNA-binding XRE family transcriptional regulator